MTDFRLWAKVLRFYLPTPIINNLVSTKSHRGARQVSELNIGCLFRQPPAAGTLLLGLGRPEPYARHSNVTKKRCVSRVDGL